LHTAVLLFGFAGLFGKWISVHPVLIVFGRVLVASLAFALLLQFELPRFFPARGGPIPHREKGLLVGCGAILALHWYAFFQSIQVSTVAVGLLSYSTAPVFVVLLEPIWFREAFSPRALLCALLTIAGVALVVPHWGFEGIPQGEFQGASPPGGYAAGALWGVLAGLSFAVLSLLNRGLVARYSSVRIACYQDVAAMVILAFLLPFVWEPLSWREVALLGVLGLLCTAAAHTLFIQALRRTKARTAAIASALEPVYGIVLAWGLLGESPPMRTLLGGALILAAVSWGTLTAGGRAGKPAV
jgi:drug/metabolite transporter (DMT)-like permease